MIPAPLDRPDRDGRFGDYGGRFAPETLMPALAELESAFADAWSDPRFVTEYQSWLAGFAGRPTPLYEARRISAELGMRVLLKREDLAHTGAHKINNAIGQCLLAVRMGKPRVIAETGAGQHGVATATAAAAMGLDCTVYMGEVDIERQNLNVVRMRLLGAEVVPVASGAGTLKDAVSEALRAWVAAVEDTHYVIGSVVGPHPYPWMVHEFQKVIGEECIAQLDGETPDVVVACVGGGSNAIGIFHPFLGGAADLVGVEAAGEGIESGRHGASVGAGSPGVLHGTWTLMLQDADGQVLEAHSISPASTTRELARSMPTCRDAGLARYDSVTDDEALEGLSLLARTEGIIPALESAHAIAWLAREKESLAGRTVLVCLSGRGDKDVHQIGAKLR